MKATLTSTKSSTFDSQAASNISIAGGTFCVFTGNSAVHNHHVLRESSGLLYREVATAAFHNSSERFYATTCHPNTRLAVLSEIMKWIKWEGDINSFTMWLYGPTRAGKSAIAQTIAEMCEEEMILLASFFFSRTDPSRNNVRPLIATIAYQITLNIPDVRDAILGAVERDPLIFSKSFTIQFKSLIVEPLRQLVEAGLFNEPNSRRLVIIDGLDECVNPKVQRNILEVLANAQRQHRLPLIFLFASRPEQHISLAFNTAILPTATTYIALDESFLSRDDIKLSCNKFQDIKSTHRLKRCIPRPPLNISQQFVEQAFGSTSRSVFCGPQRKLVLAFEVGTKYSGISYSYATLQPEAMDAPGTDSPNHSILDPGVVPEIKGVTRFPAHEHISGASKIPTVIYYDRAGKVKAVGAEAMKEGIYETAEDEQWIKAEWFKLHLRSRVGAGRQVANEIPPLPLNKTVVEVFADFMAYLLECASSYIHDGYGAHLWASVKDQIDFVLSHPNGWEGTQQGEMRKAAILAKLIPDTPAGHARLSFVTEGKASLHFAMQNGLPIGSMKDGGGVTIVDAGEETIGISSYSKNVGGAQDTFEQVATPQCYFLGSAFVTVHARLFLETLLRDSMYLDDLEHIVGCFDKTTKLRFRNPDEPQYIRFGGPRDNDASCNICFGQLKLQGTDVAMFFEPSVQCIVKAVLDQRNVAHKPISHVVLVGDFAASNWLFNKVHEKLLPHGITVIRLENHVTKGVCDGAISFYHDHFVRTRVSKITYGNFCHIPFDPASLDHQQRLGKTYTSMSGDRLIIDSFDVIIPRNTQISGTKEFRKSYFRESESKNELNEASFSVWCYRGAVAAPKWKDVDAENYAKLCTMKIDLSHRPLSPRPKPYGGGSFYRVDYDIVLLFDLTELKAVIAWEENGVERRSPAEIMYDTTNDDP